MVMERPVSSFDFWQQRTYSVLTAKVVWKMIDFAALVNMKVSMDGVCSSLASLSTILLFLCFVNTMYIHVIYLLLVHFCRKTHTREREIE